MSENKLPAYLQTSANEEMSGSKLPAYLQPDPEPEPNRERGFTPEDMEGFVDDFGRWTTHTSVVAGKAGAENYPAPAPPPSAPQTARVTVPAARSREATASNKDGAARTGQGFSALGPMAVKPAPPAAATPVATAAVKAPSTPSIFGPVSTSVKASGLGKPPVAAGQATGKAAAVPPASTPSATPSTGKAAPAAQAKPASLFGAVSSQAAKIARVASVQQLVKTITRTRTVKTVAAETGEVLRKDVAVTKERVAVPKPSKQSQGISMGL